MANEDQAQADLQTETTVVDPADATNSTESGANALDDWHASIAALNLDDISEPVQGEQPAEEETEPEPEQISEEEQPEPEASEEEEEPEPAEAKVPDRFRFKNDEDKAVAAIAKAKGVSLIEAAKIFEGQSPTKHQAQGGESNLQQEQAEAPSETVDTVKAEIRDLEAKAREAQSALNFDEAEDYREKANELREKIIDLKLAERDAAKEAESKQEQEFFAAFDASERKALQFYPDAGNPESPQSKEMLAIERQMKELGDPLYFSENKPFILAQQAAVKLGIPMTKPGTAPKAKASVQHRPMQPAGGSARTTTTDPAKKASEEIDGIGSMRDWQDMVANMR